MRTTADRSLRRTSGAADASLPDGREVTSAMGKGVSRSDPMLLTVEQAAELLQISRYLAYDLIAQRKLPHIRLGRIIRVPRHGLEQWIARQAGLPLPLSQGVHFRRQDGMQHH